VADAESADRPWQSCGKTLDFLNNVTIKSIAIEVHRISADQQILNLGLADRLGDELKNVLEGHAGEVRECGNARMREWELGEVLKF
jgi:hypothetical protein